MCDAIPRARQTPRLMQLLDQLLFAFQRQWSRRIQRPKNFDFILEADRSGCRVPNGVIAVEADHQVGEIHLQFVETPSQLSFRAQCSCFQAHSIHRGLVSFSTKLQIKQVDRHHSRYAV